MKFRSFTILFFACACADTPSTLTTIEKQYPNRLYFSIDSINQHVVVPVRIGDTVTARLVFDTDDWPELVLDSTFFFSHHLMSGVPAMELKRSFPVIKQFNITSFRYDTVYPLTVGTTVVNYPRTDVMPLRNMADIDGIFNIPQQDTTHVWELNFEENYLEVHAADSFQMPDKCIVLTILGQHNAYAPGYCIQIPLQMICDQDTLRSNYLYRVDTGMLYELLLVYPAKEITYFFNRGENAWYAGNRTDNPRRLNIVKATAWDSYVMDTLASSSLSNDFLMYYRYVGLSFLRRFNVFFNMKTQQIGLLPVEYASSRNVLRGLYFCVDREPTIRNAYRINFMPDLGDNYYRAAGLTVGDEIRSVNGIAYQKIVQRKMKAGDIISQSDTLVFDIFRDQQPMTILVPIPE
jgi:hypothetical protein